jgi:hypothetical protein
MERGSRQVVLIQVSAERDGLRFWVRLRLMDGIDRSCVDRSCVAPTVDAACDLIRAWLEPLENEWVT